MEDKSLPEGFVEMVDCCRYCAYSDILTDCQMSGRCKKHDIVVGMFNICNDYED